MSGKPRGPTDIRSVVSPIRAPVLAGSLPEPQPSMPPLLVHFVSSAIICTVPYTFFCVHHRCSYILHGYTPCSSSRRAASSVLRNRAATCHAPSRHPAWTGQTSRTRYYSVSHALVHARTLALLEMHPCTGFVKIDESGSVSCA